MYPLYWTISKGGYISFCLQVLNFLQTEGWSAFYRKFLRISNIKELWAMTRRHSRHSSYLSFQSEPSDRLQTATEVCLVESRVLYVGAKESLPNISRSGEKGGPACGWWKVESTMCIRRNDGAMLLFDFYERAIRSIHLQMREANLPLTSHLSF